MLSRLSEIIVNYLSDADSEISHERELYEYAVCTFVVNFFPLIISLIVGFCCGKILDSILLIIPFLALRRYSGGYHSKHVSVCMISSIVILGICIYGTEIVKNSFLTVVITILTGICICIFGPIENVNKQLSEEQVLEYKRILIIRMILCEGTFVFAGIFGMDKFAVCIAIGIFLTFALQLPCVVGKILREIHERKLISQGSKTVQ